MTVLWYEDAGPGCLEAYDRPDDRTGVFVFVADLVPYDPFAVTRGTAGQWSVDYHPLGDPATGPEGNTYGPFANIAEAKARLEAAWSRYVATDSDEAGLEYLESVEYPWPGLA